MSKADLFLKIRDASGVHKWIGKYTGEESLPVTIVATVPGTGATNLGKAEDAAHASGDTGVMILGVRNDSAATTLAQSDGDYGPIATGSKGQVFVANGSSSASDSLASAATLQDITGTSRPGSACIWISNGSTFDRMRGNVEATGLASAARTASTNTSDITNYNARGVIVVIDATAASATPSVVFTIQGKDSLSGQYYTILASAAVTGISTTTLVVYPGNTVAANLSVSTVLPRVWRVLCTAADADSLTYSIGYSMIL